jgi:hypothetical protein
MEDVGIFCGKFLYFTAKWFILWPFGTFCGYLVIFSRFGMSCRKKSGNPGVYAQNFRTRDAYHELACATHCLVAVMKASGLKRPPSQMVHDLRPRAPDVATDLEMPSSCLILKQKSLIH